MRVGIPHPNEKRVVFPTPFPTHPPQLRADGSAWVSRYARGGSARAVSARRFYVAVDALGGHLASNGAAPYPAAKVPKLLATLDEAVAQLDKEG